MSMLPVMGLHAVQLHCRDVQRAVVKERLTASFAAPPGWVVALCLWLLGNRKRWTAPRWRTSSANVRQYFRWIVARP